MSPVLVLASKTIIKYGRGAYKVQQTTLGVLNGFAEETVSGQKIVKVFNHEEMAAEEFSYLNEKLCDAQIKAQFRAGIMGPVTHQICNLIYGVTACIGGLMVALRGFDVGGLTVILNFTRHFNRPINEISMQINTVFSALAGAERVFEVMDEKEEKTIGKKDVKIDGHITVENLSFGYKEGILVLKNISLAAAPGQKIAFVGITTPESFTKSTPAYFQDEAGNYIYGISGGEDGQALYDDVQSAIDAARAEGAELVIALGHLGVDPSSKPWTSEEVIANVSGLDAFIDGHSHTVVFDTQVSGKDGASVELTQTGEYFGSIGMMLIDGESGERRSASCKEIDKMTAGSGHTYAA